MKNEKRMRKKTIPAVMALTVAFSGGLTTLPSFVNVKASAATVNEALSKEEVVKAYLNSKLDSGFTKSVTPYDQFKIISEQTDSTTNTYHVRTVEQYKGIPIYASGQTVALDENNNVIASFGNVTKNLSRSIIPSEAAISEEEAVSIAKSKVEDQIGEVKRYDGIDTELTLYPFKGKYYLTYLVKASTSVPAPGYFHYFVDATNGQIVDSFNAIDYALPEVTPVAGRGLDVNGKMQSFAAVKDLKTGTSYLHGASVYGSSPSTLNTVLLNTYDAHRMPETAFILLSGLLGFTGFEVQTNSSSNFFYDPAAVSAHMNADKINKYYQLSVKRNSLDGKGMSLTSTVHVGSKWNNAAWNGKQMLYGDGDGIVLGSLAGGLDVTGHEMTHGVISNSANLTYKGESGALNESIADIFGQLAQDYLEYQTIATTDPKWEMGETIYTPTKPGDGGLRSLSDPGSKRVSTTYMPSGYYPDTYDERYLGDLDNGGVHINSGINNKAAYLIAKGGTNNGYTIKGLGNATLQQILYRALTLHLTPASNFKDMREALIQSSREMYPDKNGVPSAQTKAVMDAYSSVGIN
ncbi:MULTISPECIES: M4 family metallopeptidase [Bacillaceae]|uniref:Neutral metalloproteinase n=1 Tax=Gottfriedia luciferensis TaxID=178774 RepID=A0ABX2ZS72_9BACI|nr:MULTISPECIES: M4 family metallopeptidase [Bacillaceae]ODG92616.1 peptidase M4 [Gottfriedia luciferensis]PGZ93187.1 peptidase M4 family protein [Bacillus sp. AFS029533]